MMPKVMQILTFVMMRRQMLHDPTVYPNPMAFDPTRFLPEVGKEMSPDPRNFVFGFGRRICPGTQDVCFLCQVIDVFLHT